VEYENRLTLNKVKEVLTAAEKEQQQRKRKKSLL
jgi:hypothetical protein